MNNTAYSARAEARHALEETLLPAFDEIAKTLLQESHVKVHACLESYLDGRVAIESASFTRRAVLLAIHDMKNDLEAPLALQEKVLVELLSLEVRPKPELKFYRDIATALLRIEVVIRSMASRTVEHAETRH
jgi:hypothetical protein